MRLSELIKGSMNAAGDGSIPWQIMLGIPEGSGYIQMDIAKADDIKGDKIKLTHTTCVGKVSQESDAGMVPLEVISKHTELEDVTTWMLSCGLWYAAPDAFLVPAGNKSWVK